MTWLNITFNNPTYLYLLLLLPVLWLWQYFWRNNKKAFSFSTSAGFSENSIFFSVFFTVLNYLHFLALGLLIVAFARPQEKSFDKNFDPNKGVDIVLAIDVSLSMLAEDLRPNRLSALKEVAEDFVLNRPFDRIGLVIYSGEAVTKVPLTMDRNILVKAIQDLQVNDQSKSSFEMLDGTAIGVGLASAINHLRTSKAKSKVIILITDGKETISFSNGLIQLDAKQAAQIAAEKKLKVYTIGVGTNESYIPAPFRLMNADLTMDEELLKEVADETGGKYFHATDNERLTDIYNEINSLEKSDLDAKSFYNYKELYYKFLLAALIILVLDGFIRFFVFKELV